MMPQSITVLFLYKPFDRIKNLLLDRLRESPNVNIIFPEDISENFLLRLAPSADIIVCWDVSENVLNAAKNLKLFITPYTGVEHLTRKFREMTTNPTFTLVNAHGASTLIAQHAMALLLSITNHIVFHHKDMEKGSWIPGGEGVKEVAPTIPLHKSTIGLLGYGKINQKVHKYLANYNCKFAILRNKWQNEAEILPTEALKFNSDQLKEFLQVSQILIIAAPLTNKTKGMITEEELKLLGQDSIIVNVGRADIIEEKALYDALKSGAVSRAALDVWYRYRPDPDEKGKKYPYSYPFHELPNVIISPHRADSPFDDLDRWDDIIENIRRFSRGDPKFLNEVNIWEGY